MKRAIGWLGVGAAVAAQPRVAATLSSDAAVALQRTVDLDGDGRAELVVITAAGQVTVHTLDGAALRPRARLALAEPQSCLVAFADIDGKPGAELLVLSRAGASAYALAGAGFAAPIALLPRARLTLRTGQPSASSFARDLDGDGRLDLVVPGSAQVDVWLRAPGAELTFARAMTLPVDASIEHSASGEGLQSTLASRLRVPALDVVDLNGDGRPDLQARAGQRFTYRLQASDASFGAPQQVDLDLFRDTTPRTDLQLGATATLGDATQLQTRDLDGDGVPDYVVAHRRKFWVFLADRGGPQFARAQDIKSVAEDITAALPMDLDRDGRPDLLLLRLLLPSQAAVALGLVRSLEVDVHALGYRNECSPARDGAPARVFAATPAWRRTITVRLPPLLSLIERQEELLNRLTAILDQARLVARGEVDGAAPADLVRVDADGSHLELWPSVGSSDAPTARARAEQRAAELLFTEADTVFDVERILRVLDSYVAGTLAAGAEAQPSAKLALRERAGFDLLDLALADLDGDGRAEAVLTYREVGKGQVRVFDVVRFTP